MATQGARLLRRGRALLVAAARVGERALPAARALAHAVFAGLVVGGVLVAPVLATLALVGLIAPQLAVAHQAAPALIIVSLVWLAFAIFGAHSQIEHDVEDDADLK